jgi:DNA-binding beta-propeller fold protein YncE
MARREAAMLSLAALVLLLATATALAATGALTQPAGTAGCVSQSGSEHCADGHGLNGVYDVAASADGKSLYAASFNANAVARFNRSTSNVALAQPGGSAGCISETGAGPCADGHALSAARSVAVSPDGKSVYVASYNNAVVRLDRNTTTGGLSQPGGTAGCVSQTGAGPCVDGHGLKNPASVTVSPDGKSVYVVSPVGNDVARLNRNTTTGALSQSGGSAGCLSEDGSGPCADGHGLINPVEATVSPDGKNVYVASSGASAVARLDRNTSTGALTQPAGTAGCINADGSGPCAIGQGLSNARSVAISADGKSLYVASPIGDSVVLLTRNTTTGALSQPTGTDDCVSELGAFGIPPCMEGHGINSPASVSVSSDGKSVYVASVDSNSVARLDRNTTTGGLSQSAGTDGCVSQDGSVGCADGRGLQGPASVTVTADGKSVYLASLPGDDVARFNRAP